MQRSLSSRILVAAPLFVAFVAGCAMLREDGGSAPATGVAARIGDDVLTVEELDASIKDDLFARETRNGNAARLYDLRSQALKGVLADRVLDAEAEHRGITRDALIAEEFPLADVGRDEIEAFHASNSRLKGVPLERVEKDIRNYLQQQARAEAIEAYVGERSEILLERERVEIRPGGPSIGPDEAPVTIVEYSDFQCPFCQRASPVLKEIAKRHPENVRVVYRHLPLDSIHPRARASAEAAACADEGGKFWAYHDLLFENNRALEADDLRHYAEEVGLDPTGFDECMESRRHAPAIQEDVAEAQRIGITGTPAFVVNGIVLFGLQTVEALDEVVRNELARAEGES